MSDTEKMGCRWRIHKSGQSQGHGEPANGPKNLSHGCIASGSGADFRLATRVGKSWSFDRRLVRGNRFKGRYVQVRFLDTVKFSSAALGVSLHISALTRASSSVKR